MTPAQLPLVAHLLAVKADHHCLVLLAILSFVEGLNAGGENIHSLEAWVWPCKAYNKIFSNTIYYIIYINIYIISLKTDSFMAGEHTQPDLAKAYN